MPKHYPTSGRLPGTSYTSPASESPLTGTGRPNMFRPWSARCIHSAALTTPSTSSKPLPARKGCSVGPPYEFLVIERGATTIASWTANALSNCDSAYRGSSGYFASGEVDGISDGTVSSTLLKVVLHRHYVARGLLSGSREVQYTDNQYKDEMTWLSQEPPSLRPRFECSSRRIELAGQPSESIDNRRRNYRNRTFASCWWLVPGNGP